MNSALKPVLTQGVPATGGQTSPAKANVAGVNHAGHPQGAQNSMNHGTNNLVGQNLSQHPPVPPVPAHAVPSMAPVSANMAQMAQNMSHHGNLSHNNPNSTPPPANPATSPTKPPTGAALSLVQDKPTPSQPLALTRTPDKKDEPGQTNGTAESPKSATNAPSNLKPLNADPSKDKQDIAKTSPSTPKPPEKPSSAPSTPQKPEATNAVGQADGPAQSKLATTSESVEKSPAKPVEAKAPAAPTADVAPTQSDSKPALESASDNQKPVPPKVESAKADTAPKVDPPKPEKEEPKPEAAKVEEPPKPESSLPETKKPELTEPSTANEPDVTDGAKNPVEKPAESPKEETKEVQKPKAEPKVPKSTLKLATVTTPVRKRRQTSPSKSTEGQGPSPPKKTAQDAATPDSRSRRNRTQVQLYQSPTPELAMATKLSASAGRSTPPKQNDEKLIVFYKNEYLAVRNAEGTFYVCQALQNVYRNTRKIKIRWLSQDKSIDASGQTYKPDFYDTTDMECVLTTLSMSRSPAGGGAQILTPTESARAKSILERAIKVEQGGEKTLELTEEHPDGLDLSLYRDESQLEKKKSRKRAGAKTSPRAAKQADDDDEEDDDDDDDPLSTPAKKGKTTPKRGAKTKSVSPKVETKKRPTGSTTVTAGGKTATALSEKSSKVTPAKKVTPKKTPAKKVEVPKPAAVKTPVSAGKGRRAAAAKETKPSPIVPTPSTSTGKMTRTPRKPPAKK